MKKQLDTHKQRRILVIDDDDHIREIMQLSLEMSRDWKVLTAASGEEGLEIAIRQQPDAIILDVVMPGMDGPTTVQKIQQNETIRNIPIVLLTAAAQTAQFVDIEGVQAILSKLLNPSHFAEQVAEVLGWL
ncbi:MAG: response regulator [Cyanobacteriota bacterium]|nr:response regulator [Cyanobacteriota bacterium]